jgi:hypothetical protein
VVDVVVDDFFVLVELVSACFVLPPCVSPLLPCVTGAAAVGLVAGAVRRAVPMRRLRGRAALAVRRRTRVGRLRRRLAATFPFARTRARS